MSNPNNDNEQQQPPPYNHPPPENEDADIPAKRVRLVEENPVLNNEIQPTLITTEEEQHDLTNETIFNNNSSINNNEQVNIHTTSSSSSSNPPINNTSTSISKKARVIVDSDDEDNLLPITEKPEQVTANNNDANKSSGSDSSDSDDSDSDDSDSDDDSSSSSNNASSSSDKPDDENDKKPRRKRLQRGSAELDEEDVEMIRENLAAANAIPSLSKDEKLRKKFIDDDMGGGASESDDEEDDGEQDDQQQQQRKQSANSDQQQQQPTTSGSNTGGGETDELSSGVSSGEEDSVELGDFIEDDDIQEGPEGDRERRRRRRRARTERRERRATMTRGMVSIPGVELEDQELYNEMFAYDSDELATSGDEKTPPTSSSQTTTKAQMDEDEQEAEEEEFDEQKKITSREQQNKARTQAIIMSIEPDERKSRYMTDEDQQFRAADIPERLQRVEYHIDWSSEELAEIEKTWVTNRMLEITSSISMDNISSCLNLLRSSGGKEPVVVFTYYSDELGRMTLDQVYKVHELSLEFQGIFKQTMDLRDLILNNVSDDEPDLEEARFRSDTFWYNNIPEVFLSFDRNSNRQLKDALLRKLAEWAETRSSSFFADAQSFFQTLYPPLSNKQSSMEDEDDSGMDIVQSSTTKTTNNNNSTIKRRTINIFPPDPSQASAVKDMISSLGSVLALGSALELHGDIPRSSTLARNRTEMDNPYTARLFIKEHEEASTPAAFAQRFSTFHDPTGSTVLRDAVHIMAILISREPRIRDATRYLLRKHGSLTTRVEQDEKGAMVASDTNHAFYSVCNLTKKPFSLFYLAQEKILNAPVHSIPPILDQNDAEEPALIARANTDGFINIQLEGGVEEMLYIKLARICGVEQEPFNPTTTANHNNSAAVAADGSNSSEADPTHLYRNSWIKTRAQVLRQAVGLLVPWAGQELLDDLERRGVKCISKSCGRSLAKFVGVAPIRLPIQNEGQEALEYFGNLWTVLKHINSPQIGQWDERGIRFYVESGELFEQFLRNATDSIPLPNPSSWPREMNLRIFMDRAKLYGFDLRDSSQPNMLQDELRRWCSKPKECKSWSFAHPHLRQSLDVLRGVPLPQAKVIPNPRIVSLFGVSTNQEEKSCLVAVDSNGKLLNRRLVSLARREQAVFEKEVKEFIRENRPDIFLVNASAGMGQVRSLVYLLNEIAAKNVDMRERRRRREGEDRKSTSTSKGKRRQKNRHAMDSDEEFLDDDEEEEEDQYGGNGNSKSGKNDLPSLDKEVEKLTLALQATVVGGENSTIRNYGEHIIDYSGWFRVLIVNDRSANVWAHSPAAKAEFPISKQTSSSSTWGSESDLLIMKRALGMARTLVDPLSMACSMFSTPKDVSLLSLPLHNQQLLVEAYALLSEYETILSRYVAFLGVDVNEARTSPLHAARLPFVPGLGFRKANSLITNIMKRTRFFTSRLELATLSGFWGVNVFSNCGGFLRVCKPKSSSHNSSSNNKNLLLGGEEESDDESELSDASDGGGHQMFIEDDGMDIGEGGAIKNNSASSAAAARRHHLKSSNQLSTSSLQKYPYLDSTRLRPRTVRNDHHVIDDLFLTSALIRRLEMRGKQEGESSVPIYEDSEDVQLPPGAANWLKEFRSLIEQAENPDDEILENAQAEAQPVIAELRNLYPTHANLIGMVWDELESPFRDTYRVPYQPPSELDVFTWLTGETSLRRGADITFQISNIKKDADNTARQTKNWMLDGKLTSGVVVTIRVPDEITDVEREREELSEFLSTKHDVLDERGYPRMDNQIPPQPIKDYPSAEIVEKKLGIRRGDWLSCKVLSVNERYFKVEATLRNLPNLQAIASPYFTIPKIPTIVKKTKSGMNTTPTLPYLPRNIKHDLYQNCTKAEAITYLTNRDIGEVVLRPRGSDFSSLSLAWKCLMKPCIIEHLTIIEKNADGSDKNVQDDSIGARLNIEGSNDYYTHINELIEMYVGIKSRFIKVIVNQKDHYRDVNWEQVKQIMDDDLAKQPNRATYYFIPDPSYTDRGGRFILGYRLPGSKRAKGLSVYVSTSGVSKGFKLGLRIFQTYDDLIRYFKENLKELESMASANGIENLSKSVATTTTTTTSSAVVPSSKRWGQPPTTTTSTGSSNNYYNKPGIPSTSSRWGAVPTSSSSATSTSSSSSMIMMQQQPSAASRWGATLQQQQQQSR
jgi:hypothetical protein